MKEFAELTGQSWKLRVAAVLTVGLVGMTFAFGSLWQGNPASLPFGATVIAYFAIGFASMGWWFGAIRCPSCGRRPVWYLVSRDTRGQDEGRMPKGRGCPWCGFVPERAPMSDRKAPSRRAGLVRALAVLVAIVAVLEGLAYFYFRDLIPDAEWAWFLLFLLGPLGVLLLLRLWEWVGSLVDRAVDRVAPEPYSGLRLAILVVLLGFLLLGPAVWSILHDP